MEERAWVNRAQSQMRFHVVASSQDRCWRGFEAFVYQASDGHSEVSFTEHCISMHLGRPVLVTSRCDGEELHRLQVPGDFKIVPAGYSRVWEIAEPTTKFVIDVSPWFLREIAQAMEVPGDGAAIRPQLHLRDKALESITWALVKEVECSDPTGRLYAESLGCAFAARLIRLSAPRAPRRVSGLPKRRLQRVVDYIRENVARDLSLDELAKIAGLSSPHFKTQFRESIGMPVHQYVVSVRVATAYDLLVRTAMPLSEVALHAGFYNQSHLSRHLQRVHGISPATLRRAAQ